MNSLVFLVVGFAVRFVTRWLRFRYRAWPFPDARASGLWGIAAVLVGWLLVSAIFFLVASQPESGQEQTAERSYTASDVINEGIVALIAFGPAMLVMCRRREPWASAGVSARNLGRSTIVGLVTIAFSVLVLALLGGREAKTNTAGLTVGDFGALSYFAIVGFGEEYAYRGFLQTRLIAWLGRWQGWVATSVLMALVHVSQRIAVEGMAPLEAAASSAMLIPVSLFLGYVMMRTENIVAPGLVHTFANWANTLN